MAPVNTPRAFFRLDVHVVQVDVHLGDVHLEAVGQQLDGFPHGAIARPSRDGEQGLSPNGSCREKRREFPSAGVVAKLAGLSTSTITTTHPKAKNPRTCPRKKLNRGAFKKNPNRGQHLPTYMCVLFVNVRVTWLISELIEAHFIQQIKSEIKTGAGVSGNFL